MFRDCRFGYGKPDVSKSFICLKDSRQRAEHQFIRINSELETYFHSGFDVNRYGPIIASARSGRVLWPSIEINRLVESREKTGKAKHRLLWVPGPPSFALLASREWSGVAWRLVTSQPVAIHCPLCSLSLPPRYSPSPYACARTDVDFFSNREKCLLHPYVIRSSLKMRIKIAII